MLTIAIGIPGAGKTTYLAYMAKKYLKKGKQVYSNVYIEGCKILEHDNDLNQFEVKDGLVIVDEGGTVLDNRSWKNHSKRIIRWYKMHRHYNTDVIITSQDYDIDVKIRALCQKILVIKKSIIPYCISVRAVKTLIEISEDETQIVQKYKWKPILLGGWKLLIAPIYWKYFNSYYRDKLKVKEWFKWTKENENLFTFDFTNEMVLKDFGK